MTNPTPRQRRHAKTKQAILDVARELINQKGYQNISLREIARQADFSPAGLYEYYKSKEDILLALGETLSEQMLKEMDTVPAELPPGERLVELSLRYVAFALNNPEFFDLLNNLPSRRVSLEQPASSGSPYLVFLQAVGDFAEESKLQLEDNYGLEEITYGLWALIHGMATLRLTHLQSFQANFEEINRRILENFLTGLQANT